MMRFALGLIGLLFVTPMLTAATPKRNWSPTATMKPDGAYVIGSPTAKVKLMEWASYTCSHCAHFSNESGPVLKDQMIRSGSTSLEVRHLVRDPLDLGAAILTRCAGPRGFAGAHAAVMAAQDDWLKKGADFAQLNAASLQAMTQIIAVRQLADAAGLTAIVKARGLTEPAIAACFADKAATDKLLALSASVPADLQGTPTFYLNGKLVPNVGWAQLESQLRAAGAK